MKLRLIAAAVAALLLTAGNAVAQDTSSEKGKLSYALGYDLGRNAAESGEQVDINTVIKGLQDGYKKAAPSVPVDQLRTAVQAMQKRQAEKAKADWDKAAAENKTKSDTFLSQNKGKPTVKVLNANNVQYRVIETGTGAKPSQASTVKLEVSGPYPWGQRPQQAQPAATPELKLSEIQMPAMREVLLQMPAGSKWEVTLPPAQAYGADPRTNFPPNVAVQFEIKLVSVK
ncbi:FKBP-type peptidyl-prolyl cis-trans isomerase N-terminal domain-containing protein [Agrilutibacter solisilvae]|uniref:Peptidyl-prolyl cis-trans isomerase n=1 Tax=Agrilutibacter solisilvae TaxID=2763317 RepID=A0A974XWT0_9GAMM|nr:FKBP-type peptidyl-prolyl cis-trans isomerase N-terminal domain-containing protein [Lysobacter solisilvae]QSX77294.1 FKBP-type peptidyl-prolyl cis-trans isomerase [Lysobacter solisilvae]